MSAKDKTTYVVYVSDNFHPMGTGDADTIGEYDNYEEAVKVCQDIVSRSIEWEHQTGPLVQSNKYQQGMTGKEIYDRYINFGDDPFIRPEPEGRHFSAWDYAKEQIEQLAKV